MGCRRCEQARREREEREAAERAAKEAAAGSTDSQRSALAAGSQVWHTVVVDGVSTGRRFSSLLDAQRYASQRGPGAKVRRIA